jgi:hypothetical protein
VEIEPLGDDLCRITTAEDTLPWLAFRLVLLEADFEIQDPPEMQLYLHDLGDRFVRCAAMHARK